MSALSLRARLLLATVALVTLGLIVANTATYALLRSSLVGRLDEQLVGSGPAVTRQLFDERASAPLRPRRGLQVPVTFVMLVSPAGNVIATRPLGVGISAPEPKLPGGLPGSVEHRGSEQSRLLTTGSDGSIRYRVLATALPAGQGTIALAYPMTEVDATLRRLLAVEGAVSLAVLVAVAAMALWLVRLGLRPLTEMEQAAADIADGNLSRRIVQADEHTEVGRLGRALNVMLERIEVAFEQRRASEARLRRFVADASHELRTPLTSIRGYAELFRHGAGADPEDVAKSMRRIEEESARMGTLVEELLLLARLDQSPVLDRAPVDLSSVTLDAVADARARDPDRPIEESIADDVVVQGDGARLRQVVANLMSNALEHTPAGTPVHVRLSHTDGLAHLEVADEGPGLASEHAAKVFDRFFRVDPARTRESGGAGLGLSIVAAIVHAHGGQVSVQTAPGHGARFIVELASLT